MTTRNAILAAATVSDPRWAAVAARDPEADGKFFYSVRTTGVYCRPSCAARLARPENVRFHLTAAEAERAGFRPCKRCKPDQPLPAGEHASRVAELCRFIESARQPPTLDELAKHAGWSAHHLHRVFKANTGLTPRAYAAAARARRLREELDRSPTVTAAIYRAGYSSSGRFYEGSSAFLGMTPSRYRAGGVNTEIRFAAGECSLGSILVARSDRGVCAIFLGDDPDELVRELQGRFPKADLIGGDAGFERLVARVVGLVEAPALGHDLPLDVRGTAFQRRVWQALQAIPPGKTSSYADIAERIGSPRSVRAVARACGANPLAVAIPCHRVVRKDGGLSGYRWGVERKRALLERERDARRSRVHGSRGRRSTVQPRLRRRKEPCLRGLLVLMCLPLALTACRERAGEPSRDCVACSPMALFNGKDTSGWLQVLDSKWVVENGALVARQDPAGRREGESWLITEGDHGDFILTLSYRITPGGNSGVFLRDPVPRAARIAAPDGGKPPWEAGFEVNINAGDPNYPTGSIWEIAKAPHGLQEEGEWNDLKIKVQGNRVTAWVNGKLAVDATQTRSSRGAIGLQRHGGAQYRDKVVEFKDIVIQELR